MENTSKLLMESFIAGQQEVTGHRLTLIRKDTKESAFYTIIPNQNRKCRLCIHFDPVPNTNPPAGVCERVYGIIDPDASCDDFSAK